MFYACPPSPSHLICQPSLEGDMVRDVPRVVVDLFVCRCIQLETPQMALAVFGNYQKYHLKLSLNSAQALMYNYSQSNSAKDILYLVSYYDLYKLMPVEQDPTSCAMSLAH
ncbi:hypothetical protein BDQ17DRAFT_1429731 [Cyathus striatus]|nr:hypothetical protein BDQ17DRAFT_1429731 [Cyathus striatus]